MTFAGATLIDNIFDAGDFSWINSNNIKLYMLHGTCDEVVPFNVGRVTPKCPFIDPTNYTTGDNFPIAYGSRYLYNKLKNSIPIRFEEVCRGGHQPLPKSAGTSNLIGAWDFYDVDKNNIDEPRNLTDPVEDRIVQFAEYLFNNVGTFSTGFYGFTPERITSRCFTDTTDVIQIQSIADSGSTCSTPPTKIKITAGGQNAMIYQWKVGRANWFTTDVPFLNLSDIPGYFLLSDVLTCITGKQTIEVDIEIRAINGCNTKTYTTRRTFNYFTPPSQCSSGSRFSNTNENLNDGLASRIDDYTKYTYIENKNLENEELEIVITDINGSVLSRKNIFVDGNNILALSPKETKIDILPIGVYFLQIKSKNQASNVIKFIIR
jgi:hypothetical protein